MCATEAQSEQPVLTVEYAQPLHTVTVLWEELVSVLQEEELELLAVSFQGPPVKTTSSALWIMSVLKRTVLSPILP